MGTPKASGDPVVLDMAMSQAAWGKVYMYQREGRRTPFGWGLDRQGNPTDDPEEIIKSRQILPMGQHKGAGLSLMIDLTTGILADGKFGEELVEEGKGQPWATAYTQAFIAIDIRHFTSLREFQKRVDGFVSYVKSASCVEGFSEVNVPGERAWKEEARRIKDGIPIDNVTLDQLHSLAAELGIPLPSRIS